MEFELFTYKKQGQRDAFEQTQYEDRLRQLLLDLETQAKQHIIEINNIHDNYRESVNKTKDLEDKIQIYQNDYE